MVPQAISIGINRPMNIKISIGTVAILQPCKIPSSICAHFVPVAISRMTAKAMENTKVRWISGEYPRTSCAIITTNKNAIITMEMPNDGFLIVFSFISLFGLFCFTTALLSYVCPIISCCSFTFCFIFCFIPCLSQKKKEEF